MKKGLSLLLMLLLVMSMMLVACEPEEQPNVDLESTALESDTTEMAEQATTEPTTNEMDTSESDTIDPDTSDSDTIENTTEEQTEAPELVPSEGLSFESYDDGTCAVIGIGTCTDTELVIPDVSPNGDAVIGIGFGAFQNCSHLTSVHFPDGITYIRWSAFSGCEALMQEENGVYYIDHWVVKVDYEKAKNITTLEIKEGTVGIADRVMDVTYSQLTELIVPDSLEYIGMWYSLDARNLELAQYSGAEYIGNKENPYMILFKSVDGSVTSCEVHPDTKIINRAFMNCSELNTVVIPNGVKTIADSAFENCTSLVSVNIPNSVTAIGMRAFANCSSLTEIAIPESVSVIALQAFAGCNSLSNVSIASGVNAIGASAFGGCMALINIDIPDSVSIIAGGAFEGCTSLTQVTIPGSVTVIGGRAFSFCDSLKNVEICEGVKIILGDAFYASGVEYISIPSSVEYIEITEDGFVWTNLRSITVAESNTNYYSKGNCLVSSESGVVLVGCSNSVIPDGVTEIGRAAFWCINELESIIIPNSVERIDMFAFYGCEGLNNIYFTGTEQEWAAISIEEGNDVLATATIHYNYVPEM